MDEAETVIGVEDLEAHVLEAIPEFREECAIGRATMGEADNFYHLLLDFNKFVFRAWQTDASSSVTERSIAEVETLLERGSGSVRDAVIIEIIQLLAKNEAFCRWIAHSKYKTVAASIDTVLRYWAARRRT